MISDILRAVPSAHTVSFGVCASGKFAALYDRDGRQLVYQSGRDETECLRRIYDEYVTRPAAPSRNRMPV